LYSICLEKFVRCIVDETKSDRGHVGTFDYFSRKIDTGATLLVSLLKRSCLAIVRVYTKGDT